MAASNVSGSNEPQPGPSGTGVEKDESITEQEFCGFIDTTGHVYFIDAIDRDKFTDREGNQFELDESENGYYLLNYDGQKGKHFDFDDRYLSLSDTESAAHRKSRFLIETMNKEKPSHEKVICHPIQRSLLISVQDLTRSTYLSSDADKSESNADLGDGDEDMDDEEQQAYLTHMLKEDGQLSSTSSESDDGRNKEKLALGRNFNLSGRGGGPCLPKKPKSTIRMAGKKTVTSKPSRSLDVDPPFVYELAEKLCSLDTEQMIDLLTSVDSFGGRRSLEQLFDVLQMMDYGHGESAASKPCKPKSAKKCLQNLQKHCDVDDISPVDEKFMVEIGKRRDAATRALQSRIGEIINSTPFDISQSTNKPPRRHAENLLFDCNIFTNLSHCNYDTTNFVINAFGTNHIS